MRIAKVVPFATSTPIHSRGAEVHFSVPSSVFCARAHLRWKRARRDSLALWVAFFVAIYTVYSSLHCSTLRSLTLSLALPLRIACVLIQRVRIRTVHKLIVYIDERNRRDDDDTTIAKLSRLRPVVVVVVGIDHMSPKRVPRV